MTNFLVRSIAETLGGFSVISIGIEAMGKFFF
jgi:hypothetical protein